MKNRKEIKINPRLKAAQTIVEYTLLFGVLVGLLVAMTPMIRRASQGMIKIVADQVGSQKNAEQAFDERGELTQQRSLTTTRRETAVHENFGNIIYQYRSDSTQVQTATLSNMGWAERQF